MDKREFLEKCQEEYNTFKDMGKEEDYIFQALAYMGNASNQMAWANTVLDEDESVSKRIKDEMKQINVKISELQILLRGIDSDQNKGR